MNKLRLIKIYELRGKVHPIEASIIDLLDGIEEQKYGDLIYYKKDDNKYFDYNIKFNEIYLYNSIYKLLKYTSGEETNDIIGYLLEKHLKLEINGVK